MSLALMALATGTMSAQTQPGSAEARRIEISLEERRLWLLSGHDTLLAAPVAVGRRDTFWHSGAAYSWSTPTGERTVRAKRQSPVWIVPDWHYYERAATEQLALTMMVRGRQYPLADGSHLEVRGRQVVRVLGQQFWRVPQGSEAIIDGVLFVPPVGTAQREIPGALGSHALDLGGGYLIHGTSAHTASSIGSAASHGCVRMHNDDVQRLFEMVNVGTIVRIR